MMVHRVENTLLLDEFDVHKHLMMQTEDDWEWLRKFFYNHILESFDRKVKLIFCFIIKKCRYLKYCCLNCIK